jgi:hypothetical protein
MKMLTPLIVFVLSRDFSRVMPWSALHKAVPSNHYLALGVEGGRFAIIRSSALFIFWRSTPSLDMLPASVLFAIASFRAVQRHITIGLRRVLCWKGLS